MFPFSQRSSPFSHTLTDVLNPSVLIVTAQLIPKAWSTMGADYLPSLVFRYCICRTIHSNT